MIKKKKMQSNDLEKTKELVKAFLEKSGFSVEKVEIPNPDLNVISVYLKDRLKRPVTDSISHLIKKIAQKQDLSPNFLLDFNGFLLKDLEKLKKASIILANRAVSFNTEVELKPMNSFKRFIVHKIVSENVENAKTYSKGEGKNRRVVIAPDNQTETRNETT